MSYSGFIPSLILPVIVQFGSPLMVALILPVMSSP
jgi:hypothetical protein